MPSLVELTETGATVPYGICLDSHDCIWIASKGGLFRFDRNGVCLFSDKHEHPKQITAFSSVRCIPNEETGIERILTKYADENGCFLALYNLDGTRISTAILDSPVKDMVINVEDGDIFLTSQSNPRKSELLKCRLNDLTTFETIASSTEFEFQHICNMQTKKQLIVSCANLPVNPYSNQCLTIMDYEGRILSSFSRVGKENGEIFWPRAMQVDHAGNIVVLDKTGRLQEFNSADKNFTRLICTIPAGLANGFCIDTKRNQILITCSGLVFGENGQGAECNDWVECISSIA